MDTRLTRRHLLRGAAAGAAGLAAAAFVGCGDDANPAPTARPSGLISATPLRTGTARPLSTPRIRQFLPYTTPPATPEAAFGAPLAIVNGVLFDGTGAGPAEGMVVLVRDGRIEAIQTGAVPAGYETMNAAGKTVMPGLIDGHVHITRAVFRVTPDLATEIVADGMLPFLQQGFTTLRDVGTATVAYSSVSAIINGYSRANTAPDVVWAGPIITTVGGYPFTNPRYTASGQDILSPEEGAALVDQLADNGAGVIKIAIERGFYFDEGWPLLSPDEVGAITQRAHERGLLVTAHVTSAEEAQLALDGGVDNFAHTPLEALSGDVIAGMANNGRGSVTTATIWDPASAVVIADNARRLAEAGGSVSIGTDFGCCAQPIGIEPFLQEMVFLQGEGMTTTQLLVAATRGGAEVSNLGAETGTLEPGKRADIILVEGNPLADLFALRNVSTVVKRGHVIPGAAA